MKLSVVVLVILVFAGVAYFMTAGQTGSAPAAATGLSATPPANAAYIEDGTKPEHVIFAVSPKPGTSDDEALAYYTDKWIHAKGWDGEVLSATVDGGMTRFTVDVVLQPATLGFCRIKCEMPSEDFNIGKGGLVRFGGHIRAINPSDNPQVMPHEILVDGVTVHNFSKRG